MAKPRKPGGRSYARATKAIRDAEEHLKISPMWKHTFLVHLAETSNVTRSAEAAGVSTGRVYKVRRENTEFRRGWREALCEGYDHLELELLRRLREGDFATPEGGRYDFACALRILAAHCDSVRAERARRDDADEAAVYASITAKIALLRQNWEAEQARTPVLTPALTPPMTGETSDARG